MLVCKRYLGWVDVICNINLCDFSPPIRHVSPFFPHKKGDEK